MEETERSFEKRGVTGRLADYPFQVPDNLVWVDTVYKIVLAYLKFSALKNLEQPEIPLFAELEMQKTALQITQKLFRKNTQGNLIYLKSFFEQYGSKNVNRTTYLKGIIALRQIVNHFLGD
ncbi:MAG TPA: hypothetical protein ENH09_01660 [Bacteroidetes bacterium]|nr:hypothetical protein [Bacteroidota bacterium]